MEKMPRYASAVSPLYVGRIDGKVIVAELSFLVWSTDQKGAGASFATYEEAKQFLSKMVSEAPAEFGISSPASFQIYALIGTEWNVVAGFALAKTMDQLGINVPLTTLKESRDALEKEMVTRAMRKHQGNVSAVSSELGVSRPTVYELLEKFGIRQ